jgi:hypothetical protein
MVDHITAKICRDAKTAAQNARGARIDGGLQKMFGWLEIGVKFIKTLAGQWDDRSGLNTPSKSDNGSVAESSASGADRSAARSEKQMSIKTEDWSNSQQELGHCDLMSEAESIVARPESQIDTKAEDSPNGKELARRREIMRRFFNDFWSSRDEKPGTFAERLKRLANDRLPFSDAIGDGDRIKIC